jgi:hypothetical protein
MRGGQSNSSTTSISSSTAAAAAAAAPTAAVTAASKFGIIKVPMATINFNFSKAFSSLPASFGTFVPGAADASTFTINLAPSYSLNNLPQFIMTGYVYSKITGYIHVQRQFGVQTGVAAAGITIDPAVKKITFTNITKATGNFPATANDPQGYALYIMITILN